MTWVNVIDNAKFNMKYSLKFRTMYHTFHEPLVAQEFRDSLELGLTTFQENKLRKWLSDDRNNNDLPTTDVEWTKDWGDRLIASGLKHWGIIVPDDVITRGELLPLIKLNGARGVQVRLFSRVDYALQWIEYN